MSVRKILAVDDSAADRTLYKRYLTRAGGGTQFTVIEADSGDAARDLFVAEQPDCVLLDYHLHDTDGLTLLTELRALAPQEFLCAVVITGVGSEVVATTALTNGALDYLVKQQFDADLLVKTVGHAIERNEARKELARSHTELRTVNHELQQSLAELTVVREQLASRNSQLIAANALIQARNQALTNSNDQLERINADLDSFIYTASHDLRAPIANIEGLLTALVEELGDAVRRTPETPVILDMMQDSVERFKKTIADLTEIVRLQKVHDLEPVPVELAAVVRDVQLDLASFIRAADAQIDVDVSGCPAISFAEKNLRSIVYNLLSNALKYRALDRPPRIRVRCGAAADGFVKLIVQDNGLGMDLTAGRPLFAMFTRFHSHVDGSGIGLYMVKKIIEGAGGRIEVESELGAGTTFTVYFKQ